LAGGMQHSNPLELEMMCISPENSEQAAMNINLSKGSLKDLIEENIATLRNGLTQLREKYEPSIEKISEYLDEDEGKFLELE
jgi:hypothetical protein